jgi:hypothetical protein
MHGIGNIEEFGIVRSRTKAMEFSFYADSEFYFL